MQAPLPSLSVSLRVETKETRMQGALPGTAGPGQGRPTLPQRWIKTRIIVHFRLRLSLPLDVPEGPAGSKAGSSWPGYLLVSSWCTTREKCDASVYGFCQRAFYLEFRRSPRSSEVIRGHKHGHKILALTLLEI